MKPSDTTLLRRCKSDLNLASKENSQLKIERDKYRAIATKAQQEVSEWKVRFDKLLCREDVK